jgi:putative endonuclease
MIRCEDGSLYTGITTDLDRRFNEHKSQNNKSAKYTKSHKAVKIEAAWGSESRALAGKLEYHIKRLSKAQKEKLIAENCIEKILFNKIEVEKYLQIKYNERIGESDLN